MGRSVEVGDVLVCLVRMHVMLLNMVVCNGKKFRLEPEWTRVRPSLKQKSIIDPQLMAVSGNVHVDNTDIGCSELFSTDGTR